MVMLLRDSHQQRPPAERHLCSIFSFFCFRFPMAAICIDRLTCWGRLSYNWPRLGVSSLSAPTLLTKTTPIMATRPNFLLDFFHLFPLSTFSLSFYPTIFQFHEFTYGRLVPPLFRTLADFSVCLCHSVNVAVAYFVQTLVRPRWHSVRDFRFSFVIVPAIFRIMLPSYHSSSFTFLFPSRRPTPFFVSGLPLLRTRVARSLAGR